MLADTSLRERWGRMTGPYAYLAWMKIVRSFEITATSTASKRVARMAIAVRITAATTFALRFAMA